MQNLLNLRFVAKLAASVITFTMSRAGLNIHNTKGEILACHNLKQIKIFYPPIS